MRRIISKIKSNFPGYFVILAIVCVLFAFWLSLSQFSMLSVGLSTLELSVYLHMHGALPNSNVC